MPLEDRVPEEEEPSKEQVFEENLEKLGQTLQDMVDKPTLPLWAKILTAVMMLPIVLLLLSLIAWAIVWVWAKIQGVDL